MLGYAQVTQTTLVMNGKKISPISLRLTDAQHAGLKKINDATGIESATLARIAIDAMLRHVEQHNGEITLPLNFEKHHHTLQEIADLLGQQIASHGNAATTPEPSELSDHRPKSIRTSPPATKKQPQAQTQAQTQAQDPDQAPAQDQDNRSAH